MATRFIEFPLTLVERMPLLFDLGCMRRLYLFVRTAVAGFGLDLFEAADMRSVAVPLNILLFLSHSDDCSKAEKATAVRARKVFHALSLHDQYRAAIAPGRKSSESGVPGISPGLRWRLESGRGWRQRMKEGGAR